MRICLIVAFVAAAIVQVAHMQFMNDSYNQKFSTAYLVDIDKAKAIALGYDRILADIYWLLFLQYYGDQRSASQDIYKHAPDYLNLIVALDPHFIRAYWYVSFVLSGDLYSTPSLLPADKRAWLKQRAPFIYAKNWLEEANRILETGIKANPDSWDLPYIAGFNQCIYAKNYVKAAEYYERASKVKNAPSFLGKMAVNMLDRETSSLEKEAQGAMDAAENANNGQSIKIKNMETAIRIYKAVYTDQGSSEEAKQRALRALKKLGAIAEDGQTIN